jgi:hypothetical protein
LTFHEVSRGRDRFAVSDEGQLIPVREDAEVLPFTYHRQTCPSRR